jgi:hypothetical protein
VAQMGEKRGACGTDGGEEGRACDRWERREARVSQMCEKSGARVTDG